MAGMTRLQRATFAARLHARGTMLSDEAIADVCAVVLELENVLRRADATPPPAYAAPAVTGWDADGRDAD